MSDWADAGRWAIAWGPGIFILFGLYRLLSRPPGLVTEFVKAQQDQAKAMGALVEAVRQFPAEQQLRLEKLQIGIQMILDRFDHLPCGNPDCGASLKEAQRGES